MLLCFVHIPRSEGWTISIILRKGLGSRHVDVTPYYRGDRDFGLGDLAILQRLSRRVSSIAGHAVRPIVEYERVRSDARYYTFVREPISRFLSQHRSLLSHGRHNFDLKDWLQQTRFHNRTTKFIAGKPDADAAFRILKDRMIFVGLVEKFDESLLMWRRAIGRDDLDIHYGRPANAAPTTAGAPPVAPMTDELRSLVERANKLDIELYDRVLDEIYPQQVARYGENLAADLEGFQERNRRTPAQHKYFCSIPHLISKVCYHAPINLISRRLRRHSPNCGKYGWVMTERDGQSGPLHPGDAP